MTEIRKPSRPLAAATLIAALAAATSLTACNTIAGAGSDVSSVGQGVTSGAETVGHHL